MKCQRFSLLFFVLLLSLFTSQQESAADNIIQNPGFESGRTIWTENSTYQLIYNEAGVGHSGSNWYAYLGGYDDADEYIYQDVAIPAATSVTLSFAYNISTEEDASGNYDLLYIQVADPPASSTKTTIAYLSNKNATNGWATAAPLNLSTYQGKTVRLYFRAVTDSTKTTNFALDDINLTVIAATNGACGASNNATLTVAPTTGLCTAGTPTAVTGSGPWNWSCTGTNGGSTANCSANKQVIATNGTCGASNNATLTVAPTTGLCTAGTASAVTGSGPWSWSCTGTNGGSTASCSANKLTATPAKPGDCDGNGAVTLAEVQNAISMFLGMKPLASCVDTGNNNSVSSAEAQAVTNAFLGVSVPASPITGGTFGTGNFVVTVADNSIPPDANAAPAATADNTLPADMIVQSYETNVTAGAKAYTLKVGSKRFITSTVGSVRLAVPFDRAKVADQTKIDSLHLLLRIYDADDKSVVDLTGQLVGDKIVADLNGFPAAATVTVLFNPNMAAVANDPVAAKSSAKTVALTSATWATHNWAVVYDKVSIAPEVQKFLGLNSPPTDEQIKQAIKQQVASHAADAAATYEGEGFRSPTLYIAKTATEAGGDAYGLNPRYLLHFQAQKSNSFGSVEYQKQQQIVESDGNYYGRIYIKDMTINRKLQITGGTIYMAIAHELFHAVQAGYDLIGSSQLNGIIEGTATAYGVLLGLRHDGDSAATPQVRQWLEKPALITAETFKLENYLFRTDGAEAYANQDFFVYLARTRGDNNYEYLATLFEQLRLGIADEAARQPNAAAVANSLAEPTRETILTGFDHYLSGIHGTTLSTVYDDFVRQRAVEHNAASQFGRPDEPTSGLATNLFNNYNPIISLKDVQIDPSVTGTTTVNDLRQLSTLSTRALRIRPAAGKAGGDITISVVPGTGSLGTTLSGWLYRKQSVAANWMAVPLQTVNKVNGFGADSADEVIIVMINPSLAISGVSVTCEIKTQASSLSITPSSWTGEVGQGQSFTVMNPTPPTNAAYSWFLDNQEVGSGKLTYISQGVPGTYTLTVIEYAVNGVQKVETARASATVTFKGKNHLPDLQKIPGLRASTYGKFTYRNTDAAGQTSNSTNTNSLDIMVWESGTNSSMPITWSGTSFTGKREFGAEKPGGIYRLDEIAGTVSADGATLLNVTYNYRYYTSNSAGNVSSVYTQKVALQNVPLWVTGTAGHTANGTAIQQYIAKLERVYTSYRDGSVTQKSELVGTDWSSGQLIVQFRAYALTN